MKRIIILLATTVLFAPHARSQITKGNWMIGGNISYSSLTTGMKMVFESPGYTLEIKPDVGYFLVDKFLAGLKSDINQQKIKSSLDSKYSTYLDLDIGPFIRYYLLHKDNIINILIEGSYLYGLKKVSTVNDGNQMNDILELLTGPVAYFNSSASIEFLAGYSSQKFVKFKGRNNTIKLSLGLQFYLESSRSF